MACSDAFCLFWKPISCFRFIKMFFYIYSAGEPSSSLFTLSPFPVIPLYCPCPSTPHTRHGCREDFEKELCRIQGRHQRPCDVAGAKYCLTSRWPDTKSLLSAHGSEHILHHGQARKIQNKRHSPLSIECNYLVAGCHIFPSPRSYPWSFSVKNCPARRPSPCSVSPVAWYGSSPWWHYETTSRTTEGKQRRPRVNTSLGCVGRVPLRS
jgi:hypothetical protein